MYTDRNSHRSISGPTFIGYLWFNSVPFCRYSRYYSNSTTSEISDFHGSWRFRSILKTEAVCSSETLLHTSITSKRPTS